MRRHEGVIGIPEKDGDRSICRYQAECSDRPSPFGIHKGRISRVAFQIEGKEVCCYGRGWVTRPEGFAAEAAYQILLKEYN